MSPAAKPHWVLVVEDEAVLREAMLIGLELAGHPAVGAASGDEALAVLDRASRPPAVVVLDYAMPGFTGAEFRRRQLADPRLADVPVVSHSASPEASALIHPEIALTKPVGCDDLVRAVERAATRRREAPGERPHPHPAARVAHRARGRTRRTAKIATEASALAREGTGDAGRAGERSRAAVARSGGHAGTNPAPVTRSGTARRSDPSASGPPPAAVSRRGRP